MSDLLMDPITNDLAVINGDLSMARGDAAIQQALQQALQLWAGEWFLNTAKGIPYRQQVLVKGPNLDLIQESLVTTSTNVPGVQEVLDFSIVYGSTNRSASVFIVARTSTGAVIKAQARVGTSINATIEGTPT